jgi:N-acetylmuramoyl-L-alanine amidase
VIGHDDVAPGRKSDPGPAFPMESFRSRLFGRSDDDDDLVVAPDAEPVVAPGIV